jgi:hypothetical protein
LPIRWARRVMAIVAMTCAIVPAAVAAPITYTMRGVATGSLGTTEFSDATFAVTAVADTATVNSLAPGVPCIDPGEATISIGGLGTESITTPISIAGNAAWQLVAIARGHCIESGPMWTNGRNPTLGNYDLATGLPPVTLEMPSAPPGIFLETSRGMLVLRGVAALTFEASQ